MALALILIAVVIVWLVAGLVVVALCVTAAEGDRQMRRQVRRARRPRVSPARFVPTR
jgi:flagellar basal body-associated protein FliL